jgi:hypothetical protein
MVRYSFHRDEPQTNNSRTGWVRSSAAFLIKNAMGDRLFSEILSVCKPVTVAEFWSMAVEQKNYFRKFYAEVCYVEVCNRTYQSMLYVLGVEQA